MLRYALYAALLFVAYRVYVMYQSSAMVTVPDKKGNNKFLASGLDIRNPVL